MDEIKEIQQELKQEKNQQYKNVEYCIACNSHFVYQPEDTWFDEKGFDYSTKLVQCKNCGKAVVIKRIQDKRLSVNFDNRFYE